MQRIGPYRIVRTIAIGGMGEVYLAALERAGGFEKRVALKCVLPRLMADPRFVELFEREARLAAALSHRHVVQIFDFGRDHDRAWLAMEYVHGVDLKAVLDRLDAPLPLGVAVEIGVACARALDYAHRARDPRGRPLHLIHRDVSPQNVLLGFEGDVKLADFGLARAHRDPHEGGLQGKFAYMSPEQVDGAPLDARTDQFSLGVVLYEMFSGARAFFADDGAAAILERVRQGALCQPLADAAPALPAPLRHVIERALRRDRTERFESAGALADALAAAATQLGITPGEPPLGAWLRAQFPDRSAAPPAVSAEATAAPLRDPASAATPETTAAAGAPINTPTPPEHTVDAGVPIALAEVDPLGRTPSAVSEATPSAPARPSEPPRTTAVLSTGDPADGDPAPAEPAPADPAPADPADGRPSPPGSSTPGPDRAPRARRRLLLVAAVVMLAAFAATRAWMALDDDGPRPADARLPDALALDAAALPVTADAAALDSAPDAFAPDARPIPDAAPEHAPDATPRRDPRAARRPRVDPDRRRDAARPRPIADAALPIPDAAPAPDAAPPPSPAPTAGPRVRVYTPGARLASAVPADDGWRPIGDRGLLLHVRDAPGPPVRLRIRAIGGRFEAAVDASPWGRVLLGERALGATPAAAVPLEAGRQTLRVIGPDGGETVIRVEIAP